MTGAVREKGRTMRLDLDDLDRHIQRAKDDGDRETMTYYIWQIEALVRAVRASMAFHDETSWEYTGMLDTEAEWSASLEPFRSDAADRTQRG